MSGLFDFNYDSFKQEILKELRDEIRQMCIDMIAKIAGKRPIEEEDFEIRIIIGEPLKEKLKVTGDSAKPEWMKDLKRQVDQLQIAMKKYGLRHDFTDLDLRGEKPLPPKFKFPDIKKYDRT